MPNKEISDLTTIELPLDGTEIFHAKANGNSREVNFEELGNYFGRGPQSNSLGFAKFTRPGDIFTAENSGTPVTNAFSTPNKTWLIDHDADDGASFAIAPVTLGADFDKVFTLRGSMRFDSNASLMIFCGNSSSGKKLVELLRFDEDLEFQFWTNTTFNSLDTDLTNQLVGMFPRSIDKFYMRVTRVSTVITFYISMDGLDWIEIAAGTTSSHSISNIDEVGFGVYSSGVAAGRTYLRCIGYDDGPQAEAVTGGGTTPVLFKGFRATPSSTQAIPNFTETEINWGTELFDTEGAFASNRFTVPASLDGKYMTFSAGVVFQASESGACYFEVSTDGGSVWTKIGAIAYNGEGATTGTVGAVLLNTDDIYRMIAFVSTAVIDNIPLSFFSGSVEESSDNAIEVVTDSGTARVLVNSDLTGRRIIYLDNASSIILTINTGLTGSQPVTIVQQGAGVITIGGSATIQSKGSLVSSNGQYGLMTIIPKGSDIYYVFGDLA